MVTKLSIVVIVIIFIIVAPTSLVSIFIVTRWLLIFIIIIVWRFLSRPIILIITILCRRPLNFLLSLHLLLTHNTSTLITGFLIFSFIFVCIRNIRLYGVILIFHDRRWLLIYLIKFTTGNFILYHFYYFLRLLIYSYLTRFVLAISIVVTNFFWCWAWCL